VFNQLIVKITEGLEKKRIPYMIIGGQAVLMYGEPRFTNDIDITLGVNTDKMKEILALAKELSLSSLIENTDEFIKKTMVLPLKDDLTGIRIDLIFSFSLYEQQAIENSQKILVNTKEVNFARLEDIVIHKIIAGRARDIDDVKTILSKNPGYNKKYIVKWLKKFDETLSGEFVGKFNELTYNNKVE